MQWCQSYVQVKQGFCYADFDIGQADTAITMTAWLRTEKVCPRLQRGGGGVMISGPNRVQPH